MNQWMETTAIGKGEEWMTKTIPTNRYGDLTRSDQGVHTMAYSYSSTDSDFFPVINLLQNQTRKHIIRYRA